MLPQLEALTLDGSSVPAAGVASPRIELGAQIAYAGIRGFTGPQMQDVGVRYKNETSGAWGGL